MEHAKRILAIETSGRHGSVATLGGEVGEARLVGQLALTGDQRTAQSLAPAMQQLLAAAQWTPESLDLVAVTVGPGSFTGLRIGVTTAKAFAYAVGADIIRVNTL
ncbi:MAG TPA: tRNA (adenosine(37)-N6)-threonylcarbamoyltransferase complex dimerization subunit type 1 TsaB, partial [Lacipirellulaceae bacterium]|nr:tRNA (adenosine(37)-N6)-threonylcarbamoyltransferase complex dimerization subunit type 1 TsaB [Lacipirellulaceae bacterium]